MCECQNNLFKCFESLDKCNNKEYIIEKCPMLNILYEKGNHVLTSEWKSSDNKLEDFYKILDYLVTYCNITNIDNKPVLLLCIYDFILNNHNTIELLYYHYEDIIKMLQLKLKEIIDKKLNVFSNILMNNFEESVDVNINIIKKWVLLFEDLIENNINTY